MLNAINFQRLIMLLMIYSFIPQFLSIGQASEIQATTVDPGLLERVDQIFNERGRVDRKFIIDLKDGILIPKNTETSVIFMGEGAGYKNRFGYYIDDDSQSGPVDLHTIFENASRRGSGGSLNIGDSVSIGSFDEDTRIGFWVKANGYVNRRGKVFYSAKSLNPDGMDHMAMLYDPPSKEVVFGFEDLYYGGDQDYNDVLFSIKTSPRQALYIGASDSNLQNSVTLQDLASAQGMVTLKVGRFAKIDLLEDVTMYQEDPDATTNVRFTGNAFFAVEANSGVIIDTDVTKLSYGDSSILVEWSIDGSGHSTITPAGTHHAIHRLSIFSIVNNIAQIPSNAEYKGDINVTLYSY